MKQQSGLWLSTRLQLKHFTRCIKLVRCTRIYFMHITHTQRCTCYLHKKMAMADGRFMSKRRITCAQHWGLLWAQLRAKLRAMNEQAGSWPAFSVYAEREVSRKTANSINKQATWEKVMPALAGNAWCRFASLFCAVSAAAQITTRRKSFIFTVNKAAKSKKQQGQRLYAMTDGTKCERRVESKVRERSLKSWFYDVSEVVSAKWVARSQRVLHKDV